MAKIKNADVMQAYHDWAHAEVTRPPHDQGRLNAAVRFYDARERFKTEHGREWPIPGTRRRRNPARITPRAKREARKLVRRYGKPRARKIAGAGIAHARSRKQKAHFERVRKAVNPIGPRAPGKLYVLEIMRDPARGWKPFAATHSLETAKWLVALVNKETGLAVHVTD